MPPKGNLANVKSAFEKSSPPLIPEQELRRKEWDELTDKEKIERMRETVKGNISYMSNRIRGLENKIAQLEKHGHLNDKVMVEFSRFRDDCDSERTLGSERDYF